MSAPTHLRTHNCPASLSLCNMTSAATCSHCRTGSLLQVFHRRTHALDMFTRSESLRTKIVVLMQAKPHFTGRSVFRACTPPHRRQVNVAPQIALACKEGVGQAFRSDLEIELFCSCPQLNIDSSSAGWQGIGRSNFSLSSEGGIYLDGWHEGAEGKASCSLQHT